MRTVIGLERIHEYSELFRGKRIGLITNFTGYLSDFTKSTIDVFVNEGLDVRKIFTPEHGLYGAPAGSSVSDSEHPVYHIPVISLYGDHRKPSVGDLEGIDQLVYDIQDVGLRYYTYIYTMCYAMDSAAEQGIPFVVLDRPDPLGDRLGGPCIAPEIHSFIGDGGLPMRYGMTIGELATWHNAVLRGECAGAIVNEESCETRRDKAAAAVVDRGCSSVREGSRRGTNLYVIRMDYYRRSMIWNDTGLVWNVPSPAIPTFETVLIYYGGCIFEPMNISEGRGTSMPFRVYGAPYIDMDWLYQAFTDEYQEFLKRNSLHRIPLDHDAVKMSMSVETGTGNSSSGGLIWRTRSFTPTASDFSGQLCYGLEFVSVAEDCDFLPAALILMKLIADRYPDEMTFDQINPTSEQEMTNLEQMEALFGNHDLQEYLASRCSLEDLCARMRSDQAGFAERTTAYRLYEE